MKKLTSNKALLKKSKGRKQLRNGFEEKIFIDLINKTKTMSNTSIEYESEYFEYYILKKYLIDFKVVLKKNNGVKVCFYIETKGYFKSADRTKLLLVRKQYPNADIRLVFQRPENKLNKSSKVTYGDWANKNGFKWCDGKKGIPSEWLEELKDKKRS